jgi:alkylation response protein AidB-like acyl-CoA dehydrogenase
MRSIGAAERALELMCSRLNSRIAFGKVLSTQGVWHERIAERFHIVRWTDTVTKREPREIAGAVFHVEPRP